MGGAKSRTQTNHDRPEHFLTPVLLAAKHGIFTKHKCDVELVPQPSGTGQMITSYKEGKIDMAIGLTEGWINGLSASPSLYKLVGTYVSSPLCWAISTGIKTSYRSAKDLRGKAIGVSRIGSGSYVMSYVFADQQGWLANDSEPFTFEKLDTFKGLRDGVNDGRAAAFMWERFTTKKYYDSGEIRQIGEIYTPWPSWLITATSEVQQSSKLEAILTAINEGIAYYHANHEEAMEEIYTNLDYSKEDAEEWSKTVSYPGDVSVVDEKMVKSTINSLRKAGLMKDNLGITEAEMVHSKP